MTVSPLLWLKLLQPFPIIANSPTNQGVLDTNSLVITRDSCL